MSRPPALLVRSAARDPGRSPLGLSQPNGFSVLEFLVVVAIVSVLAAIGVPSLFHKSADAILDGNTRNLATLVQEELLENLDRTYHQAGDGSPDVYLSNRLEYDLKQAAGAARYSNPRVDGPASFTILNSSSIPLDTTSASPAVFITDNPELRYEGFDAQQYVVYRQRLAGSLIVHFDSVAQSVDIFFVDPAGNRSTNVTRLPLG